MANYGKVIGSTIGAMMVFNVVSTMAKKGKKFVTVRKPKENKTIRKLNKLIR